MTRSFAPLIALSPLLAFALAGCDRQPESAPANTGMAADNASAAAAPGEGYAARIRSLAPRLRDGVFLRAIRDSKEDCQEITGQYEIAKVQGNDAWAVTCDRTNHWVISIKPDGTAIVTKVSAASRLPPKTG